MAREVILYGFNRICQIEGFVRLVGEDVTIWNIKDQARWMMDHLGSTAEVIAIDNFPGLKSDFLAALKSKDFTKHIEFEDLCQKEGILIMRR